MKKRENLKEKVYSAVRTRILKFELRPGEKVQEMDLARDLGVSRTPIREVLNKLEQEGLINNVANKGYYVSDVTSKEIEELYEVREALEVLALKAARNSKSEDWENLEKTLLESETSVTNKQEGDIFIDSYRFHEKVAELSGNETLRQLLNTISDKINRLHWLNMFFMGSGRASWQEHLNIVKLLKDGDVEKAVTVAREHLRQSRESLLYLFERKKDIFYLR